MKNKNLLSLLGAGIFSLISMLPAKSQEKPFFVLDPFKQPHKTLNHYGSGDVNKLR